MANEAMAGFICALRKEKGLTQKQLAQMLNVTDKAVSKWERGQGCPDITLLPALAAALDATPGELLDGARAASPAPDTQRAVEKTLQYARDTAHKSKRGVLRTAWLCLSGAIILGSVTCFICDVAITNTLTWSLVTNAAMLFAWLLALPPLCAGRGRVWKTLAVATVFVVPLLAVIEWYSGGGWLWKMGVPLAAMGAAYLWLLYLFGRIFLPRRAGWYFAAVAIVLSVPLTLCSNALCDFYYYPTQHRALEPLLNIVPALLLAVLCVGIGFVTRRRK